jgi:glycosyltransferase involved in cell wall biosynthesis
MDISIVVPFRNAEAYIGQCVEALCSQDYPASRYEILMVSNNSSDRSGEIAGRHPRVRLLAESRPGPYAARNRGVRAARAPIIAFTDSDCAPAPDWLRSIELALSDPSLAVLQGRVVFGENSPRLAMIASYEAEKAAYVFSGAARDLYYGYTNNMAARRELFDRLGPFVETIRGGDVLFVNRVARDLSSDAIRFVPGVRVRHLEITRLGDWYRKLYTYGKSYQNYSRRAPTRPLTNRERFRVFRNSVHASGHNFAQAAVSLGVLSVGALCYELGRRTRPDRSLDAGPPEMVDPASESADTPANEGAQEPLTRSHGASA